MPLSSWWAQNYCFGGLKILFGEFEKRYLPAITWDSGEWNVAESAAGTKPAESREQGRQKPLAPPQHRSQQRHRVVTCREQVSPPPHPTPMSQSWYPEPGIWGLLGPSPPGSFPCLCIKTVSLPVCLSDSVLSLNTRGKANLVPVQWAVPNCNTSESSYFSPLFLFWAAPRGAVQSVQQHTHKARALLRANVDLSDYTAWAPQHGTQAAWAPDSEPDLANDSATSVTQKDTLTCAIYFQQ